MEILCKTCAHNNVCKHRYDYEKTIESLDIKVVTPFSITLKCPFYSENKPSYYSGLPDLSNFCTPTNNSAFNTIKTED